VAFGEPKACNIEFNADVCLAFADVCFADADVCFEYADVCQVRASSYVAFGEPRRAGLTTGMRFS
jgi:hypothetical protein